MTQLKIRLEVHSLINHVEKNYILKFEDKSKLKNSDSKMYIDAYIYARIPCCCTEFEIESKKSGTLEKAKETKVKGRENLAAEWHIFGFYVVNRREGE